MDFIIDHFWKFVLIITIGVGGKLYYSQYQKDRTWDQAATNYARLTEKLRSTSPASAALPAWEADFWRLMIKTDETVDALNSGKLAAPTIKDKSTTNLETEGRLRIFIQTAGAKTGYKVDENAKGSAGKAAESNPINLLTEVILENYTILSDCGVWGNPEVRLGMANGEAPTVQTGPYSGEKLRVVRRISPHLFRDGITDVCNIILLPESAAALYFPEVDDTMKTFASRMDRCGLLDKKSLEAVLRLHEESSGGAQ
jgi:hypothetical protein